MNDGSRVNRPPKREVITISDDEDQPIVKISKREAEPVLSTRNIVNTEHKADELEMRLVIATSQLELTERRAEKAFGDISILSEEKNSLLREVACLKSTITDCSISHGRLEQRISSLMAERAADRARIDQLIIRLAQYENPSALLPEKVAPVVQPSVDNDRPPSLCLLIQAGAPYSVPLDDAVAQIRAKFYECGALQWSAYCTGNSWTHSCDACSKQLNAIVMMHHFVGKGHIAKVRTRKGAVSLVALKYWLRELQIAANAAPAASAAADFMQQPGRIQPNIPPTQKKIAVSGSAHPRNLCQLIRAGLPDTISFDAAVSQLRAKFDECGLDQWKKYFEGKRHEYHPCKVCNKNLGPVAIIGHFLSKAHDVEIRAQCSAVSLIAVNHWLHELQKAIDAAAAAAAAPAVESVSAVVSLPEKIAPSQEGALPLLSSPAPPSIFSLPYNVFPVNVIAHPMNIFELIRPNVPDSISFDAAVSQLFAKYTECGHKQWSKYLGDKNYKYQSCKGCNTNLSPFAIIGHFLSKCHNAMIREHCSAVSLIALNHWLHELQNAIDEPAADAATTAADNAWAAAVKPCRLF